MGTAAKSVKEGLSGFGRDFKKGWKRSSTTSKVGLAMSATGLSLGAANYANSLENKHDNKRRGVLEAQSLNQLKDISESLKKKPKVTVNFRLSPDQEKMASISQAGKDALMFAKRNPATTLGLVGGAVEGAASTTKKRNESSLMTGLRGAKNTIIGGVSGAAVGTIVDHGINKYIRK